MIARKSDIVPVSTTGAIAYCQNMHAPIPPAARLLPYICTCSIMLFAVGVPPSTKNVSQKAFDAGTASTGSTDFNVK